MFGNVKRLIAVAGLTACAAVAAWAAPVDGKWTWNQRGQGGNEVAVVLELKQDGEKLTGTLTRGDMKTEIKEGTIKGADLAFVLVRVGQNGQERKTPYKGKLDGDKITGTITTNRGGEERTQEWVANRVK
jgi:hypothetical protein